MWIFNSSLVLNETEKRRAIFLKVNIPVKVFGGHCAQNPVAREISSPDASEKGQKGHLLQNGLRSHGLPFCSMLYELHEWDISRPYFCSLLCLYLSVLSDSFSQIFLIARDIRLFQHSTVQHFPLIRSSNQKAAIKIIYRNPQSRLVRM